MNQVVRVLLRVETNQCSKSSVDINQVVRVLFKMFMVVKIGRMLVWFHYEDIEISSLEEFQVSLKLKLAREPRGFGFVQYVEPADAAEAKYQMDGQVLQGRQLTVVFAEENRKKPSDMRVRDRGSRGGRVYDRRRSPPPRYSRSPPPRYSGSRGRDYYSPPPKRREYSRSVSPQGRRYSRERSYSRSPGYDGARSRSRSLVREQSPPYNGSRSRTPIRDGSPVRGQSRSRSRSRSRSPIRSRSRSPNPADYSREPQSPSQ